MPVQSQDTATPSNMLTLLFFLLQNEDMQQQIIKETFQLVSKRDDNVCNFLEGGRYVIYYATTEINKWTQNSKC